MHAAPSPVAITGCVAPRVKATLVCAPAACNEHKVIAAWSQGVSIRNYGAFICKEMRVVARAITTCSYYNSGFYYSRTIAVSGRRSMLTSSGDSLETLSSILSGEGFDEDGQGAIAVRTFGFPRSSVPSTATQRVSLARAIYFILHS
jgi:hypothetical protein